MGDYEIRTMQGDLERLMGKKPKKPVLTEEKIPKSAEPPENLPIKKSSLAEKRVKPKLSQLLKTASTILKRKKTSKKPRIPLEKLFPPKVKVGVSFLKTGYLVLLAVLIFFILVNLSYFWHRNSQFEEEIESYSIIDVEQIKIIEMKTPKEGLMKLEALINSNQQTGTLKRILLKDISNETAHYLLVNELFDLFQINVPSNILEKLENDYMFLSFGQEEGNKTGLIIKIRNPERLVEELKEWEQEQSMVKDLSSLFFSQKPEIPEEFKFLEEDYKGVIIRYINPPHLDLGINYTIIRDRLIITTSKKEIKSIIDRFLE